MRRTDIFVIGGGPAGLAAAIAASERGFTVTVADGTEAPIDKACGEGLMPQAVEGLRKIGIDAAELESHVLQGIRFIRGNITTQATFSTAPGFGVRRAVLHRRLVERAGKAGVELRWNTPVAGLGADGAVVAGRNIPAEWVVGADGLRSRVGRWIGLERGQQAGFRYALRRHYNLKPWSNYVEVYWGRRMQAYVTPVGPKEVCVACLSHNPQLQSISWWQEFPELAARLRGARPSGVARGAITMTRRLPKVYRGRVVLTGDASGSVDAITGEGLSLGFQQAEALAAALALGDLSQYQRAHRRLMRWPTFMARLLLLLDHNPALCYRTMCALASDPSLFAQLLRLHFSESCSADLASAGARLGWRLVTV
jgi:menaquinone-9 beta-reductase